MPGKIVSLLNQPQPADFYARCAQAEYANLARRIQDHQIIVPPMHENELRDAIRKPADQAGLHIEDALIEKILAEVKEQPAALPLLQDALTELCQSAATSGSLNLADYNALGGHNQTLARRADDLYQNQLTKAQQQAARWILIELIRLGEGAEDTRRRVLQSSLATARFEQNLIDATLAQLTRARLVVTSSQRPRNAEPDTAPVASVEVAHEALIRHWPRLHTWLDEERDTQTWLRRLRTEAQE